MQKSEDQSVILQGCTGESDENWFVEKTSGNKKEAELLGETLAHNMQKKYGK